ncbi:MAG: aminodeoxychorismate lyase [Proteobacteria bacterium]|nr:aminodeoxychorismate lyase [Pseudomonadota bacterium]
MFLVNGQPCNKIGINDRGLQYGDGLFETIAVQDDTLLCWDKHISRLEQGCNRLNIPIPDQDILKNEASLLINSIDRGVIKVIITRGQGGRGYALPDTLESTRIVSLYPWPEYPNENSITGINTLICHYQYALNPILAGIKHLNRLEQILARSEWTDVSITEGIVLDQHKNVIEGTMSNLFYIINDTLCTPDLSACGVEGIIRQKIIELATDLKIDVCIKKTSFELLSDADEVFVCNSIIGVWPVKMIGQQSFLVGNKTNEIKLALQARNFIPTSC